MRRGAGVAMALPWLESMPVWGQEAALAGQLPKRLAILFMANGVNPDQWWAEGAGDQMQLGPSLAPLEPHKAKLTYISGLFNRAATGVGIHPGMTGNLLSGARLKKGAELGGGISMDQVLANAIGGQTVQPSLVLGCEQPTTGYHETNFSMAYGSHISWQNSTSAVPMEVYPSLAFDSLFENRGAMRNRSILDRVMEHAEDLSRKVSATDQAKLDEYLTSVREVEQRIDRMREQSDKAEQRVRQTGESVFAMERPENGLPEDIREHMQLMCDIVALAFQTDKTRIATLLLCRDISGLFYPFLGIRNSHHPASHEDRSQDFMRINQYYCSQLAYLTSRLESMPEGEGTVMDHSCLMFLSNMWSGSQHDNSHVPVLLMGDLAGELKTGRVLDYYEAGDENRKLCSLYLSLMDRMGVSLDEFGDADARLARL
jgi:hypothetical protein